MSFSWRDIAWTILVVCFVGLIIGAGLLQDRIWRKIRQKNPKLSIFSPRTSFYALKEPEFYLTPILIGIAFVLFYILKFMQSNG